MNPSASSTRESFTVPSAVMVIGLTVFPETGVAISHAIMHLLTHSFGSAMQFIAFGILVFLIALSFSKYGDIRLGNEAPEYPIVSWVAMMFFCGNGAGTVYWAFLEWGYHFNAAPQLHGVEISEAYNYEQSLKKNINRSPDRIYCPGLPL